MPTIYEKLGGEAAIRALVDHFYDRMELREDAATIRAMHPEDLTLSRQHLHLFLMQWSGGPTTYSDQRGHPRMRMRHLPFAIDVAARDAWLACMRDALDATVADPTLREDLYGAFVRIAAHMQNRV